MEEVGLETGHRAGGGPWSFGEKEARKPPGEEVGKGWAAPPGEPPWVLVLSVFTWRSREDPRRIVISFPAVLFQGPGLHWSALGQEVIPQRSRS